MTEEDRTELFSGVRVVELASWVFVPVAGALLADWGAEVTKVEHPVTGDGYRGLVTQGMGGPGVNPSMELANRGKRSIGLDLKSPAGHEVDVYKRQAQFNENVWISPFWEDDIDELARVMPVDHIIAGSDWPHPEGLADPTDFVKGLTRCV